MAEKIVIEFDLQRGDTKAAFDQIEKEAAKSGKEAGKDFRVSFSRSTRGIGESIKSLAPILTAATAAAGALATGLLFRESIQAAAVQEDAINRLNGALKSSGDFSQQASEGLQEFASELQRATRFGDEVILNQLALAKSFGATNEQAREIVTAATDLSAALGIDLESATRNVAKTLGGYAGELGETIPQLKELTTAQLQAGEGIALLANQFQGQAQNAVQTFSGRLEQAQNTFGDLLETIGGFITQNPFVLKAIGEINNLFTRSIESVSMFFKELDTFNDVITPLINFGDALITYLVAPLEFISNAWVATISGIISLATEANGLIGSIASGVADVLGAVGIENNITKEMIAFGKETEKVANESTDAFKLALNGIFDFPIADSFAQKNQELREGLTQFNETLLEQGEVTKEISRGITQDIVESNAQSIEQIRVAAEAARAEQEAALASAKKLLDGANRIINQGLTRAISGGIQNITAALAAGKNVFEDFGAFILTTFGDLAIQLGEFYIAEGLAKLALLNANPTAQITAGASLIAIGSIIKSAFSGSGSSGSSASSGVGATATDAGASGFNQSELTDDPGAIERTEPQTAVSINIQGDVLDSDESGTRIAKILSDSFGKQGIVLSDARFA